MAILDKKHMYQPKKIEIDLTGPDGNVFVLFAYVKKLSKETCQDSEKIISAMMQGDYDHALLVFDHHFGKWVTLYK